MASLLIKPYALDMGEGPNLGSPAAPVFVEATSEQTGGAFNIFAATFLPGYATSLHIHYAEDVAVYVLKGALTVFWGSEKREAAAGSFFFQPRGTPHGFRVEGATPARILYISLPAGLDRFAIAQSKLPLDPGSVAAAARHRIEILGPLPE
jgi:quercetin dioxygenase-like cupin family protein